ncbi:LysE family translocator [Nocardia sp. NPDC049149]|uniref:LysE family translocator n=1 Tax=Nocardia sp. NPDC049149 TaxID=3364315 RepID=UPI003717DB26
MLTFALAALVLIMIPGPDQALITRNALAGGRVSGLLTTIGGVLGLTLHASAAAFGLSALLLASPTAFTVLKIVGAAYLLWLGLQTLRAAWRSLREPVAPDSAVRPGRRLACLRQGFLSNALNPKVTLFFVTFLPQFIATDSASPRTEALLLSVVFAVLYIAWFGMYVAVVDQLAGWLRKPKVKARIEQVTGLALVTVAVRLATAHQ